MKRQSSTRDTTLILGRGVGLLAVVVGFAGLNIMSEAFMVAQGVAFVYPAAAVAVLGGVLLGWWGVAAVVVGVVLSPWGLATTPVRLLFFAAANAVTAAVPAAARLGHDGRSSQRTTRVIVYGVLLNTILAALIGVSGIAHWAEPALNTHQVLVALLSWFLSDATAVLLIAVPILVLVRPELLLSPEETDCFRSWLNRWQLHLGSIAFVAVEIVLMNALAPAGMVSVHWVALFLLAPVLLGAALGGIGGGLVANGVVGVVYVAVVIRLISPESNVALFREVFTGYINLAVFALAAIVTGTFAGRARVLVTELDDNRHQLQRSFESVVTALAAAIEAKDPTTEGHVQRVAGLAVRVGRRLGIEGGRLEMLRYAAILHDVGKIGVPETVLNKRADLSPDERDLMERHVRIGVDILGNVDILEPAIPLIRYHQERWDGRSDVRFPGYFGLQGEAIPLEARIIAVVDAFDAMINDRPYRRAMSAKEALAELTNEAGSQFDPRVVEVLIEELEERPQEDTSGRWPILGRKPPEWLST